MEEKQVSLKNTREIELPSLDVSKYVGKKAKIISVTEHEGQPRDGQKTFYIKVKTEVLGEIKRNNGDPILLQASRIFGLQQDVNGNIGWGANTKLGAFLAKMKVKHYKELIGKEVTIKSQTSSDGGKESLPSIDGANVKSHSFF
ncbi:MAG: hypothetical protein ACP5IG_04760 [Candidatus Micrarchaeia archaeon]